MNKLEIIKYLQKHLPNNILYTINIVGNIEYEWFIKGILKDM